MMIMMIGADDLVTAPGRGAGAAVLVLRWRLRCAAYQRAAPRQSLKWQGMSTAGVGWGGGEAACEPCGRIGARTWTPFGVLHPNFDEAAICVQGRIIIRCQCPHDHWLPDPRPSCSRG